jgi:hypothetical protein
MIFPLQEGEDTTDQTGFEDFIINKIGFTKTPDQFS